MPSSCAVKATARARTVPAKRRTSPTPGTPIPEVDHVHDIAKGGPDHPEQMIALCPNCHAIKTRGRTREQLRRELLAVARQRHQTILSR